MPEEGRDSHAVWAMFARLTKVRLNITGKLLGWCLALSAVFSLVIFLLISRVKDIQQFTGGIVGVNYRIVESSEIMATRLLGLIESKGRFEILGKEEYRRAYLQNLAEYEQRLGELARLNPESRPWDGLYASLQENLPPAARAALATPQAAAPGTMASERLPERLPEPRAEPRVEREAPRKGQQVRREVARSEASLESRAAEPPANVFLADAVVNGWLKTLGEARAANRQAMHQSLTDLGGMVDRAVQVGWMGLASAGLLGLAGSGFIAWGIYRGLGEIRRGIRLTKQGRFEPVRVLTGDELGDLAAAFNRMTQQLGHEEQMRADFISMLSHEIRTPLTSVREAITMIKQGHLGPVTERQHRFLDISGNEINRLANLLTRLMQVSSMESADLQLDRKPEDGRRLLEDTVERLAAGAAVKGIALAVDVAAHHAMVLADAEHVRQVLLNLAGNAVKFSPEGSTVTLRLLGEPSLRRVVFCVEDQGPGIPEEEQPFVFRKYYRAQDVRNSVDGAGLGLSIAKRIVEAHDGVMWVKSAAGQGSSFCFALPEA